MTQGLTLCGFLAKKMTRGVTLYDILAKEMAQGVTLCGFLAKEMTQGVTLNHFLAKEMVRGVTQCVFFTKDMTEGVTLSNFCLTPNDFLPQLCYFLIKLLQLFAYSWCFNLSFLMFGGNTDHRQFYIITFKLPLNK